MSPRSFLKTLMQARVRSADDLFRSRLSQDRWLRYLRSCAVCRSFLPPIDFLCPSCWRELGQIMNRGPALRQSDYVLPTYSLLTWTPQTASFVRPLIYAFKDGRAAQAAEKLATLFLTERASFERQAHVIPAPANGFDHATLWAQALVRQGGWTLSDCLEDKTSREERQKDLRAGERGLRRYGFREHFAMAGEPVLAAKPIVFADDVVTSGSTAMAAYMALGDPERFEVWTLVARPRLATRRGAC